MEMKQVSGETDLIRHTLDLMEGVDHNVAIVSLMRAAACLMLDQGYESFEFGVEEFHLHMSLVDTSEPVTIN